MNEHGEPIVTPTEALFVRLSTGERVYWTDGSTSERHCHRLTLDVSIPPHLPAIQDGINAAWRRLALIEHG